MTESTDKSVLDQIKDTVTETIKDQANTTIQQAIEALKDKLTANGIEFTDQIQSLVQEAITSIMTQTGESVSTKVESFLDSKKDQWAQLAVTDPDEARRKLRTFWMGVSGICAIIGAVLGFFADKFI